MRAVAWMVGTLISFCIMAIGIRELSGNIPVVQMLLVRSTIGLMVITGIVLLTKQVFLLNTKKAKLHLFRNVFHFTGQYGWYLGIGLLPLAEVFALEFTVPIWTAIIAALFLNEKFTARKVIAISLGFLGVLIIVQPGIQIVDSASLIVLVSAIGYAIAHSTTKALTNYDKPIVILFYMSAMQVPIAMFFAWSVWVEPNLVQWLWLAVIGLTALSAHYCMTKAMSFAEITTIVTIDFMRLPVVALLGVLVYQEAFEIAILIGGALMLVGNLINAKSFTKR